MKTDAPADVRARAGRHRSRALRRPAPLPPVRAARRTFRARLAGDGRALLRPRPSSPTCAGSVRTSRRASRQVTSRRCPIPQVAARFVIETVAWFANHRYGDHDGAQIPNDVAEATVVQLVTAGLVGADDARRAHALDVDRRGDRRRRSTSRPRRSTATTATSSTTSRVRSPAGVGVRRPSAADTVPLSHQ